MGVGVSSKRSLVAAGGLAGSVFAELAPSPPFHRTHGPGKLSCYTDDEFVNCTFRLLGYVAASSRLAGQEDGMTHVAAFCCEWQNSQLAM